MADTHAKHHDYHLVKPSPNPFIGSIGAFIMAIGGVAWMRYMEGNTFPFFGYDLAQTHFWLFAIGVLIVLYVMFSWWSDTIKEAHEGYHTPVVSLHLRYGMIMFIASEVMFFVAWFWAFFDASLFPGDAEQVARAAFTGGVWPPKGMEVLDPFHLPLYNTIILLLSGTTVTWAHHSLINNDRKGLIWGLVLTVALGVLFTSCQAYEYIHAPFAFKNSIYGATFFMATGFHFVDVVWLFLFTCIYVWASHGAIIAVE
ncbi:MAG: cytochrome c oxidase subunit 3 [Rhizobiales bacterium]|nr:cytochrome c oxidase subunit 3 [Hyphomicrobiales bacterium]